MKKKNYKNPDFYLNGIYLRLANLEKRVEIIDNKLKWLEKLLYFVLSIISAIFVKLLFF